MESYPNIMIVEDDSVQISLLDQIIKSAGLKTVLAMNGQEAQEKLKNIKPNLILIDLHMPDMTGFQLLKFLKSNSDLSEIPVIMMSIDTSEESAILCISSGANSYINKPIRISELFLKIKKFLNYSVPDDKYMEVYNVLKSKSMDPGNNLTSDMINYVFGGESYQEAKSIYTFASILTIRIHGLLPLVQDVGSEKIQQIYDDIISTIYEIIYRNRGAISSVFNDLIFCTFGIPVVYDNDTVNALQCANDLLNTKLDLITGGKINGHKLELSISIMSGKVYLGAVRTMQSLNASIIGNPLIRAMRFESLPVDLKKFIIIDKNTKDLVNEYVDLNPVETNDLSSCYNAEELFKVIAIHQEKIAKIPNILKQYTPKDSVSSEGYEKL